MPENATQALATERERAPPWPRGVGDATEQRRRDTIRYGQRCCNKRYTGKCNCQAAPCKPPTSLLARSAGSHVLYERKLKRILLKRRVHNSPSAAPLVVALAEGTQSAPCKPSTNVLARSTGWHVLLLKTALTAYYERGCSSSPPPRHHWYGCARRVRRRLHASRVSRARMCYIKGG